MAEDSCRALRWDEALAVLRRAAEAARPGDPLAKALPALTRGLEQRARLPAVLDGKDRSVSPAEAMAFAELCHHTRQFATAARFCDDAFAADPRLIEDRQTGHRYNAACSAAMAGATEASRSRRSTSRGRPGDGGRPSSG